MPGLSGETRAFIIQAGFEGANATAALEDFRAAGGRVANGTWYRSWGEIHQGELLRQGWSTRDLTRLPRDEMIGEWSAGQTGRYAYDFRIPVRDVTTGIETSRYFTIATDRLISPASAIQQVYDQFAPYLDEEHYDQKMSVPEFQGVYRMTGIKP